MTINRIAIEQMVVAEIAKHLTSYADMICVLARD